MHEALFDMLDLDKDGLLSRSELYQGAKRLGWYWREAPVYALLDLFSVQQPISKKNFAVLMHQILQDPMGPYGKVLLTSPIFTSLIPSLKNRQPERPQKKKGQTVDPPAHDIPREDRPNEMNAYPETEVDADFPEAFDQLYETLGTKVLSTCSAVLLIIDPQRAFTNGVWMQSLGPRGETDIAPIQSAFNRCARHLKNLYGHMETMFTRCPFPPESYLWDEAVADAIDDTQLYFIKPGNSVMFPPSNGYQDWVDRVIDEGLRILVIGGCTLNSCVRVSSLDTYARFKSKGLQVIVDLSICGARRENFISSPAYGGRSAVESAIRQMTEAGIQVKQRVTWK
jgi:nicotinamidase-related amidase